MKKFYQALALVVALATLVGCSYDDEALWNKVKDLDERLTAVELTLSQMNNNVSSLSLLVQQLQNNVYVTGVTQTTNGYVITFSDGTTANILNGTDGLTPRIGNNGNWWIGDTDTGVKAAGTDGLTPYVGDNGNWWLGTTDTGVKALGQDGKTPYIGPNGNWWIDGQDTGKKAVATDGETPYIGSNGNWWIGTVDTGVSAGGNGGDNVPIIGIDLEDGVYYWTQTINGMTTWLYDRDGNKLPVSGYSPIFKVDASGYLIYSIDGGVTWIFIYDQYGNPISTENCQCRHFFQNVYVKGNYLYLVLMDGTTIKIRIATGTDIPDDPTEPTPDPGTPNITIPYPSVTPGIDDGEYIVTMNLTGIQHPTTGEWVSLYGTGVTGQNVWVEVDGTPKGIKVLNLEDNTTRVKNDIVFTVDNSGSMSEEANAIARDIIAWAQMLTGKNLDVQFGVVGFGGYVDGAINLTSATALSTYLNASTGTGRTQHFGGPDANNLQTLAGSYTRTSSSTAGNECGAMAVRFANDYFAYRATANRIYVKFTDEPNQPNGIAGYSVYWFKDQSNWPTSNGTIHTVYSDSNTTFTETSTNQYPWRMSEYTGGTKMFIRSDASDLQLDKLTVSDAMTHAYTIRFRIPASLMDGNSHRVRIVVFTPDRSVRGFLNFDTVFGRI